MAEHVTFFRMKVQPGKMDEFRRVMSEDEPAAAARGWTGAIVGQSKNDENEVWGAVSWDTSDNYYKNADSPEQNESYQRMRALLSSDPEWFDCNVVQESHA